MELQKIFELVKPELRLVEKEFERQMHSPIETVAAIGRYLQQSGGKRVRPTLLLLCAKFCGYDGPAAIRLATVVEFIHTATLIHDDIIDGADLRRGRASTNAKWGNHISVLAGDWLYMQSYVIALEERNFRVLEILTDLTQKMVEGELIQLTFLKRADVTVEQYLDICARKTAYLFAGCGRLGAVLGGLEKNEETKLGDFGMNLGLAFQIADDILDFSSTEQILGKPVVSDLKEGKVTLPLIHVLQHCSLRERQKILSVLEAQSFHRVNAEEIQQLVEKYRGLDVARQRAQYYTNEAMRAICDFPPSVYKDALTSIASFIVARDR